MGRTLTLRERVDREAEVSDMIESGMTVRQIAERQGVSPQAVRKFLAVRGWKVKPSDK